MSERSKDLVLKTSVGRPTVGSNPTLSVVFRPNVLLNYCFWLKRQTRRGDRAAEGGTLLRCCAGNRTEGSNPSLSEQVPIAQLDRASVCGIEGQRFEPSWAYHRNCRFSVVPFVFYWRGDRVAEGVRLESVCTAMYRGFESPPLRNSLQC